ncbi:MAG: FAD-dependent oxidoreductase [Ignavibacteria bacterium]|nr:FAD-dependent oxidoreductase [Ignavibacteria bacterium]
MKNILVVGGGFAGVQSAIELAKEKKFSVTLLSDRDYLFLYPISIWIPTGEKKFKDVALPLSEISKAHGFSLIKDKVESISAAANTVICTQNSYQYDYLVIATGAAKIQHKGMGNTLSICGNPEVSLDIKNRLDTLIQKKHGKIAIGFGGNPKDKSAVRGGPAFELMFNIHNLLKKKGIRQNFELTFFAPMESPGERMGQKSLSMLDALFKSYNIGKMFGKKITEFAPGAVIFEDGSQLESDLILFIPASTGADFLSNSDIPLTDSGFVKIDDTCQVSGSANIYAVGDAAAIKGPAWIAKQGHIAEIMGRIAAQNIVATENGILRKSTYPPHLNILCIMDTGNGAAFVYRDSKYAFAIPMPGLGHWLKRGWGQYAKLTKKGLFPRLPGL